MYRTDYYVAYPLLCGLLLGGLAFVLHRTAQVVSGDPPDDGPPTTKAVARLLAVGLYAICLGYVAMTFTADIDFDRAMTVANDLVAKAGFFFVLTGFLQVINVLVLAVYRRRRDAVAPSAVL
ncbi:MAG TPA: hypothetical protein VME68_11255 [Acidobacteriaceae bacterium]|nr:hypothetical protein [Acidobacteriaceae bacterium]